LFRLGAFLFLGKEYKKAMKKLSLYLCTVLVLWAQPAAADITYESDLVVVTATRIAQHNYSIASNLEVITSEEIAASTARTVPDVLREALGIHVFDQSTNKTAVLDIRGMGDSAARNVLVLVNDRKLNNVDISGPDLIQVPIDSIERIEVIRGAGSVLYGDNAIGGVVNIITKEGEGDLSGKAGVEFGSYDARAASLEVSGQEKRLSYFIFGGYDDERGFRQNSDVLKQDTTGRFGYDVTDNTSVDIAFGWHKDRYGLPGGISRDEIAAFNRRQSMEPNNFATTKDKFIDLTFDFTPWPEDGYIGNFVLDFSYRDRDVFDTFFGSETNRETNTYGVAGKYIFDHELFGQEMNFVTGVDYYDHENDIKGSGTNAVDLTISKEEWGVYTFAQYEALEDVFVNAGTRFHQAHYAFSQRDVAVDEKQRPSESVNLFGMKWEYNERSNAHFNVQQTFRFLATDEWYSSSNFPDFGITPNLNTSLKQQTGIQYEVGAKHNFDDKVIAYVTPYWIDNKNEIFFDPANFINSNYDKTRRVGVEFGQQTDIEKFFEVEFLDKLGFFSNYTYQVPKFNGGTNDKKFIPLTPRHQASAGLVTRFWGFYNASLIGRYVGSRFAINDTGNTTSPSKPYAVLDAKVSYERDQLEVFLALNNILDNQYSPYVVKSAFSNAKDLYPAPEFNMTLGVNVKF